MTTTTTTISPLQAFVLGALTKNAGFVSDVLPAAFKRMAQGGAIGGTIGGLGSAGLAAMRGEDPWAAARQGGIGGASLGALAGGLSNIGGWGPLDLSDVSAKAMNKGLDTAIATSGAVAGGALMSQLLGASGAEAKQEAQRELGRYSAQQEIKAQQKQLLAPQHHAAFADAQQDDIIAQADNQLMASSYETMKRFAPNLAADPNAVRSFLRESATWGTGPSYATLKNLADAEKAVASYGGTPR